MTCLRMCLGLMFVAGCQFATGLHGLEIDPALEPAPGPPGVVTPGMTVAPGRAEIGSACDDSDACVAGALCIGSAKPTCRKACQADSECGSDSACLRVQNSASEGFCAQTCVTNADCATNCCAPSGEGVDYCVPNSVCMAANTPPPSSGPGRPGDACTVDSDCQAEDCFEGTCYGDVGPDGACTSKYDCRAGLCAAELPEGSTGACLEGPLECLDKNIEPCFISLAIAACQLVNKCNPNAGSFDRCVAKVCVSASADYTLSQCQVEEPTFGQDSPCP